MISNPNRSKTPKATATTSQSMAVTWGDGNDPFGRAVSPFESQQQAKKAVKATNNLDPFANAPTSKSTKHSASSFSPSKHHLSAAADPFAGAPATSLGSAKSVLYSCRLTSYGFFLVN